MNIRILPLLSLLLACPMVKQPNTTSLSAPRAKENRVTLQKSLSNGMKVVLQENHAAPVVALQVWVNVGSAQEGPGEEGLAHVFEHMLFKGTKNRGVGEIAADVESAGGDINAWTSFDQTVYHITLSSRETARGVEILADALQNSTFDKDELDKERLVILEEMKRAQDTPSQVNSQQLFELAYTTHPYRRPILGQEEVIQNLTREKLVEFFQRWYTPDNMIFVAVGDFESKTLLKEIETQFGERDSKRHKPPALPQEPSQKGLRCKVGFDNIQEAQLDIGAHVPGFAHEDVPALDLLGVILGQGESSRLTLDLRNNKQYVNDIYAYSYTPEEPGLFMISAALNAEDAHAAIEGALTALYQLTREEVSQAELDKARAMLESEAVYQKETMQGQARKLGYYAQSGDLSYEQKYVEALAKLRPSDLQRIAAKYFVPENISISLLLPTPEEAKNLEAAKSKEEAAVVAAAEKSQKDIEAIFAPIAPNKELYREELANGTILLVQRATDVPLVSIRGVYKGGLLFENDSNNGINNMLARMLTKGTTSHSAEDIAMAFDSMAGVISGFSGKNSFGLRADVLSKHLEPALELFAECLLDSTFPEDMLEKERKQVLEEIKNREDNVAGEAFRLFSKALYTQHPYRLDVNGSEESVRQLHREQLQTYFDEMYPSQRLVISIVGDINPEKTLILARKLFGERERHDFTAPSIQQEESKNQSSAVFKALDKAQAHVVLGFPGTSMTNKDRYALEVMNGILSGQGGRLFLELRDKKSLAYSVYSTVTDGVDPGYIAVYIGTSPERFKEAIDGVLQILGDLQKEAPSEKELARAKRYLLGSFDISLQRVSTVSSLMSFNEAYGLGAENHKKYPAEIEAITAEDVLRVAKKYLTLDTYVLSAVKPEKSK